jgi:hypothetical protein
MRMIAVMITALVAVSVAAPASAQMSTKTRDQLASMRKQNPTSYETCHGLAVKRGYSTVDQELEGQALMNFITGCMAMAQR